MGGARYIDIMLEYSTLLNVVTWGGLFLLGAHHSSIAPP